MATESAMGPSPMLVLLIASVIGLSAFYFGIMLRRRRVGSRQRPIASSFVAGILIGMGLLVVLPEASEVLVSEYGWDVHRVMLLFLGGGVGLFMLEHCLLGHEHAPPPGAALAGRDGAAAVPSTDPLQGIECEPCECDPEAPPPVLSFAKRPSQKRGSKLRGIPGVSSKQTLSLSGEQKGNKAPRGGENGNGGGNGNGNGNGNGKSGNGNGKSGNGDGKGGNGGGGGGNGDDGGDPFWALPPPCECCDDSWQDPTGDNGNDRTQGTSKLLERVLPARFARNWIWRAAAEALRLLAWGVHAIIDGMVLGACDSSSTLAPLSLAIAICALQDVTAFVACIGRMPRRAAHVALAAFAATFPAGAAATLYARARAGASEQALQAARVVMAALFVYMALFEMSPPHTHSRLRNGAYLLAFLCGAAVAGLTDVLEELAHG